jgi:hypothetical protein
LCNTCGLQTRMDVHFGVRIIKGDPAQSLVTVMGVKSIIGVDKQKPMLNRSNQGHCGLIWKQIVAQGRSNDLIAADQEEIHR